MHALTQLPRRVARRMLPFRRRPDAQAWLDALPAFAVPGDAIEVLPDPVAYRERLLALIAQARRRIVLVALYLQDDDGGREIMEALYAAHARQPTLQITVFVDWHRAQRGLIGKQRSGGNADMYRDFAKRLGRGVSVYGVPVQTRELLGVLHLKGLVIDDAVLYSGASFNDVYLARHQRYRLDRYHLIEHAGLADALARFVQREFVDSEAVRLINRADVPSTQTLLPAIRDLRRQLQAARYIVPHEPLGPADVAITPMVGLGSLDNPLNNALLHLLGSTRERLVLLTPYFNLPRPVRALLGQLLRRGCQVDIMVGDKVANDFFIPPGERFRTIGVLPYLYESNLRRFARSHRRHIASGQLNLWLWRHGDNTYHLKGVYIDDDVAVLTGNNFNPRAWALDLENALILRDPAGHLREAHAAEWQRLRHHATRIDDYRSLETTSSYPPPVRKVLRRLKRVRLDRLANRLL